MSKFYDELEYRDYLEEHRGKYETVFWTGHTDGVGGEDNARKICEKHNANLKQDEKPWKTNEMLLKDAGMKMPDYDPTDQESINAWESASLATAENAFGQAHIIKGKNGRKGSIFNRIEQEAINKNPNVNKDIDFIDPKTRKHTKIL